MADPISGAANSTLNSTLNASVNETAVNVVTTAKDFIPLVFQRLWELIAAPFRHPEMFWIIFPLLFTFVVMEFYMDRHRDEELGWSAAVANSLILIIVAIDLLKHSFHYAPPWTVFMEIMGAVFTEKTLELAPQVVLLILFLLVLGFAITIINYYHLMPKKIAFAVSGHPPVNFLAYFAIVIVYTAGTAYEIPFDMATLIAGAILFIIMLLVVFGIRKLINRILGRDEKDF